jgi:hypothetical protein
VLAALVVAATGTGCSGRSDPAPTPSTHQVGTAPSSTPPTASPTTTSAADRKAAAIAAVQRLYAELNAATKSGDTTAYRKTYTSTCSYCVGDAATIDGFTRKHEHVIGGETRVSGLQVIYSGAKFLIVEGTLSGAKASIVRSGRIVERYPSTRPFSASWHTELVHGVWLVTDSEVLR